MGTETKDTLAEVVYLVLYNNSDTADDVLIFSMNTFSHL